MEPGIGYLPPAGGFTGQATKPPNPPHFNIVKKYANRNVCFSCGLDVEEGHTSQTCPGHWRKMNHQEGFTHENSWQYINMGYNPCTKGMHKSQFPTFWWWGAEKDIANKCKSLVSAYFPDPTENINAVYDNDVTNDDITVIMPNATTKRLEPRRAQTSIPATARQMFGNPMPQYLNALRIAASQAIADTGATSIFVMEGINVKNKRPVTKPLMINLPDGRQVKSMHICDINIPLSRSKTKSNQN
jgi:hypothetical protein